MNKRFRAGQRVIQKALMQNDPRQATDIQDLLRRVNITRRLLATGERWKEIYQLMKNGAIGKHEPIDVTAEMAEMQSVEL